MKIKIGNKSPRFAISILNIEPVSEIDTNHLSLY